MSVTCIITHFTCEVDECVCVDGSLTLCLLPVHAHTCQELWIFAELGLPDVGEALPQTILDPK